MSEPSRLKWTAVTGSLCAGKVFKHLPVRTSQIRTFSSNLKKVKTNFKRVLGNRVKIHQNNSEKGSKLQILFTNKYIYSSVLKKERGTNNCSKELNILDKNLYKIGYLWPKFAFKHLKYEKIKYLQLSGYVYENGWS